MVAAGRARPAILAYLRRALAPAVTSEQHPRDLLGHTQSHHPSSPHDKSTIWRWQHTKAHRFHGRPPALAVEELSCRYGAIQALWDVSFDVAEGEVAALVGPNGAGKTTALRAIVGLLRPESGSIRVDGADVVGSAPHELAARGVSLVPEARRLWPRMTVQEHLELGAYHRSARPNSRQRLAWVFSLFPRLQERSEQLAGTLSGGEQQMLAIARALMAQPKLLMLDEPSLGLAPQVVSELHQVVATLRREGVTVLIVEQNVHLALGIADRGYVLENGRIVKAGAARTLLADPTVREVYLGL